MPAKPYRHLSPLGRALELVGDRWTLLIISDLMVAPKRYTDLANGLPGIPSNLLRDRVRRLEEDDLITRFEAPPPVATSLYELTPRARELEPAILALQEWGGPLMADETRDDEPLFADSLVLALRGAIRTREVADRLVIAFEVDGSNLPTIEIVGDKVEPVMRRIEPDVTVTAKSGAVLARVLAGVESLGAAKGITVEGDIGALEGLLGA
ncbi:MAG: transcriptional regulator [Acidimicrobiia bacterium]|nr:transcriptional regulator [Acidimicrobiia bacterium]